MTGNKLTDFSRLAIHTITTKPWAIETAIARYAAAGVKGITVWRQALEGRNPVLVGQAIKNAGLSVVSLCRGGFFPAFDLKNRQAAIADNKRAIDEAAALGAPYVVLVCGADPGQPLADSRRQIEDGIAACLDHARAARVKLAIEPLHPMYAADRSAINTLKQANDLCDRLQHPNLGVAVDVYHLWWDPDLEHEIARCGASGYLLAFHICDWLTPTVDMLNDRGLMGEGCIPLRTIRAWVEKTGFTGFNEVEIFSNRWWAQDQDRFLAEIKRTYLECS
ncbi:MAG TPA: sugar phosphate isomerase/epimerase family protein [bacterium]|mgnify:CR=1 FL=1|nr:sugar phosphate isomerase/epimerase family protein [bacterium]HPN44822.1 sugar phosphate isomerase/epimerase family protein [bacterium]